MKKEYYNSLRSLFADHLRKERKKQKLTQAQIAEELEIEPRSYSNLENGKSLCSTITFLLYLLYVCPDANQLLAEIKEKTDRIRPHDKA